MSSSSSSSSSGANFDSGKPIDPIVRTALRYTLSPREYELLHQYLISRAPRPVRRRAVQPKKYAKIVNGEERRRDDYNAAAIRASFRVWVGVYLGLRGWEGVEAWLARRSGAAKVRTTVEQRVGRWKSPNVKIASSLSLILLFHRILFRFFARLKESLLSDDAKPFRRRNPRISRLLTARLAPVLGASLAGFWLGFVPRGPLRVTAAIYAVVRAMEFCSNAAELKGWWRDMPWWFGSWMLMPPACGQLLHAFVFDRDCFPKSYGSFILRHSPEYIQARPENYPTHLPWPGTFDIVNGLAEISKLRWPPFTSPILFPGTKTLPASLTAISPITSTAHPLIKPLSCALLHPSDPSCLRTYLKCHIRAFGSLARLLTLIYTVLSLPKYRNFLAAPVASLNSLAQRILRSSLFLTSAIGTAWASICFFQHVLPRSALPTSRWFLGGFIAGLAAFIEQGQGRSAFLYSARLSIGSLWKVGVKRGWWKGIRGGDVLLFVLGMAVVGSVYEVSPEAVREGTLRKGLGLLRGEGWVDRVKAIKGKERKKSDGVADETSVEKR